MHFIGDSQIIPLQYYDGKAKKFISLITQGGLKHFKSVYKDKNVTSEKILFYVYAVLNDPSYKEKYKDNLKIIYPRIPLYQNFEDWMELGKTLFNLHLNYDSNKPHKSISIVTEENLENKKPILQLQWDKKNQSIKIDDFTVLTDIPQKVMDYKVFGESNFINYICDYYKDVSVRSTKMGGETVDNVEIFEKEYDFTKYKEDIIDLIGKSIEVSIQSLVIEEKLKKLNHTLIENEE